MNDFIQMAAKQLGISEQTSKSAAGGILGMIQNSVGAADFSKQLGGVPGINDVLGAAAAPKKESGGLGGMVSGLAGKVASSLGGGAGAALGVGAVLQQSGLAQDKAGPFAKLLFDYLKGKAGQGAVTAILGKLPELAKLVG